MLYCDSIFINFLCFWQEMFYNNPLTFIQSVPKEQNILAMDIGSKKIGTAILRRNVTLATPLTLIIRDSFKKDIAAVKKVIQDNNIGGLVVGMPLAMDGSVGEAAEKIKKTITDLMEKGKYQLPVCFEDERMTTALANKTMKMANVKRKKRNQNDDNIAACLILDSFIQKACL